MTVVFGDSFKIKITNIAIVENEDKNKRQILVAKSRYKSREKVAISAGLSESILKIALL